MNQPLVSICCLSFNHSTYIRRCIEGFLMQQCDFEFEVLIHDDASTDGTADIIRGFEKRNQDKIKPIYQNINQYSKGINPTFEYNFPRAKGKYIAMCEGDDYWTDPLKLQKQVDFLENNLEYSFVVGGFKSYNTISKKYYNNNYFNINKELNPLSNGFSFDLDTTKNSIWFTKTLTLTFRNSHDIYNELDKYKLPKDTHLIYHLLKVGSGYYFNTIFGVYNIHTGGVFSMQNKLKRFHNMLFIYEELFNINFDSWSYSKLQVHLTNYFKTLLKTFFSHLNLLLLIKILFSKVKFFIEFKTRFYFLKKNS